MEHRLPVIVGVDVGGTNTDAVVVNLDKASPSVISFAKCPTTPDVYSGVTNAIVSAVNSALEKQAIGIVQVNIGTTHFVNAVVQRKDLVKVGVIRLCGTASRGVPPFADIPKDLVEYIFGGYFMINGGYEFDGRENSRLDLTEISKCLDGMESNGIFNVVVCGIFSSIKAEQEIAVRNYIEQTRPKFSVTLSHEIGHLGLLQRENAAILNECLKPLCKKTISGFRNALKSLDLDCPFYLTQNDGTIVSAEDAEKIPVCTISSGPTNSMRGAAFLCGIQDAIIVDIGGTTTDVGVLSGGFPRQSSISREIAGVRTNFRMPDVLSVGLGGGSYVEFDDTSSVQVGPLSAGFNIVNESLVFAKSKDDPQRKLTATDIAVAAGLCEIGNSKNVSHIDETSVKSAIAKITKMLEASIDKVKSSADDLPVVLVGGGHVLVDIEKGLRGGSYVVSPPHADVANAVGAALSQVSCTVEYVANVEEKIDVKGLKGELENMTAESRKEKEDAVRKKYFENAHADVMQEACEKATSGAIRNGALELSVSVVEKMDTPLAYLPGNATSVKVKAVGNLAMKTEGMTIIVAKLAPVKELTHSSPEKEKQTTTSTGQKLHHTESGDYLSEQPNITENGEWILCERDIECLSVGAGILGCGGGGSPYLGRLLALRALKEGKTMRVITPQEFYKRSDPDSDLAVISAFMGAPSIIEEKAVNMETTRALSCMEDLYSFGGYSDGELQRTDGITIVTEEDIKYIKNYNPGESIKSKMNPQLGTRQITALMSAEIGGMNAIEPLLVAAERNLPVIDCDGMGRAFPELQMFSMFIYDCPPYPSTLADDKNRRDVVVTVKTPKRLEDHFRKIVVEMGCSGGIVLSSFNREQVVNYTVSNSLSRAWFLGDAVLKARQDHTSPVEAILKDSSGKHLVSGTISLVRRETTGGFNKGYLLVEESEETGRTVKIDFQNENLVAKLLSHEKKGEEETILASVPDLISILDVETGEPIPTENVRYGLRVAVVLLPASKLLKTEKALKVIGPEAFGYSHIKFTPCGEFNEKRSVIDEYMKD